MFSLYTQEHGVKAVPQSVQTVMKKRTGKDDWIVMGAYYLPRGPWLKGSSFRRLPTKHPWRKSCAPHNNTSAPGKPHTGKLRSLPPSQGIQTHSCCEPRAPTAYWSIEEGTDYQGEKTERYSTTNSSELLNTKKIFSQNHLLISLFWSHMQHRCDVFLIRLNS